MRGVGLGIIERGSIGIADGRIAWVGEGKPDADCETRDLGGAWVTPGLIDCHTHLVFAGNRAAEFEMRLKGATYEEIAKAGGGIRSTVNATRVATEDELFEQSAKRLSALIAEGVTTVEIKSGYGLALSTELKQLRVARRLGRDLPVTVRTTFLGAHALPPEFAGRQTDYVDHIVNDMLPAVAKEGLADAVDAFCENIAFTPAETSRIFAKARELGLKVKLHADQLSDGGGAALAASFEALSADHLEWTNEPGIGAMATAGTVAVMLPGAFYCLRETKLPPIDLMRKHGVAMAVASDLNPGTSPIVSLQANMHMACTLFRMTPEEVLRGVTVNAAKALGLEDRGLVDVGCRADLTVWDVESVVELTYWMAGIRPIVRFLGD
ncbi:MAG: imidazolonepropionase [Burkholderiales bacterium]|nr:imidazolonepropionase [Burkholderiales bacterium]